ncbi:Signal transduction histidine kinase [Minicystis rosea]|nr:Signal transduction histidine kinase [Minicystis rosea]
MSETSLPAPAGMHATRAEALFAQHLDGIGRQTDRMFAWLMAAQWLFAVVLALVYTPHAWEGSVRKTHPHVFAALLLGGLVSALPIGLAWLTPGERVTRYVIAVAQMLWSSLLIHLSGGRIETHFHIFGSLAFLAFYRDWTVLVPASLIVAGDHVLRQVFWPESVYGLASPEAWRFLEHSAWVVFEDVFLILGCVRGAAELRGLAAQQASLEDLSAREREKSRQLDEALAAALTARDEAERANAIKGQFLANMSHELRTPLNGVLGMSELLGYTELAERQQRYVSSIRTSSRTLLDLVNDVLDFAKVESGKLALEEVDFDLAEIAHDVVALLAPQAHAKHVELSCAVAREVPAVLRGDPLRVRQVLTNLVTNAVKFTAAGEVVVRVTLAAEDEASDLVRVEVRDTGIGIREEDLGRLFQPFSQVDASNARKYGGTGLGLAISRELVERMGGAMSVTSTPGEGSTFAFTVRLGRPDSGSSATAEIAAPTLRSVRTLLVDDNGAGREALVDLVSRWIDRVDQAANGADALDALQRAAESGEPYRLLVTDLHMPGLDGLALARAAREAPGASGLRVVLLPSTQDAAVTDRAVDVCLPKPVARAPLRAALEGLFGARRSIVPPRASMSPARGASLGKVRVLVAEDNPTNQQVTLEMLARLGCEATVVDDGRAAVAAVARERFALVLMDCQMPEMDGYAATRAIRALPGAAREIPILAVTAHALAGERAKVLDAGMNDYLTKPFTLEQLGAAMSRWIDAPETEGVEAAARRAEKSAGAAVVLDPEVERSARVRQIFLGQLDRFPSALRETIARADTGAVRADAHKFAGGCVMVGAVAMTALCREVEASPESAAALLPAIEAAAVSLRAALEAESQRGGQSGMKDAGGTS